MARAQSQSPRPITHARRLGTADEHLSAPSASTTVAKARRVPGASPAQSGPPFFVTRSSSPFSLTFYLFPFPTLSSLLPSLTPRPVSLLSPSLPPFPLSIFSSPFPFTSSSSPPFSLPSSPSSRVPSPPLPLKPGCFTNQIPSGTSSCLVLPSWRRNRARSLEFLTLGLLLSRALRLGRCSPRARPYAFNTDYYLNLSKSSGSTIESEKVEVTNQSDAQSLVERRRCWLVDPVWYPNPWAWDSIWVPPHENRSQPHFGYEAYRQLILKYLELRNRKYTVVLRLCPLHQHLLDDGNGVKQEPRVTLAALHPYRLPVEDVRVPPHESSEWPSSVPHFNLVSSYDLMVQFLGIGCKNC
ncbi:hypothetical protein C7M84_014703 [Penaeus vannamei]|uniref:Uncharacterized protein n=1 Tax=Penaeus vannamei TaxID=6689 RepID=A0A3R7LZ71_PENVA|nr:hypothetical protein C7M84_014703 [Penaeus vannamei]